MLTNNLQHSNYNYSTFVLRLQAFFQKNCKLSFETSIEFVKMPIISFQKRDKYHCHLYVSMSMSCGVVLRLITN